MTTLADIGAVPAADCLSELAGAARGVPLRGRGGVIRAFAMVDAADFPTLSLFKWCRTSNGRAARGEYDPDTGKTRTILMHRQIMGVVDEDVEVDHRDRDPLNNTRENLRLVDHPANGQNRTPHGESPFRGVSRKGKGWVAQAEVGKRGTHGHRRLCRRFATEQEAADAAAAFRAEHMPFSIE